MSYCNQIRKSIDQADRPDGFTFETASHLSGCSDCRSFADERIRLRQFIASAGRVAAPLNFDALLNERLRQVKGEKAPRITSIGFVKLAGATASIIVAVLVAQYSGLFAPGQSEEHAAKVITKQNPTENDQKLPESLGVAPQIKDDNDVTPAPRTIATGTKVPRSSKPGRVRPMATDTPAYPIIILRDQDREVAVPMMTISVGMQQQVLNSSGRQSSRSLETSY